jgi:hypothetical protein
MQEYLIHQSIEGTGHESPWDNYIFVSIAWKPLHEVFYNYSTGQRTTQLSKYMNDLLPTAWRLQTFDNTHDGQCFVCGLLWEDTNHVLRCCGDERTLARNKALHTFRLHLQRQHTPNILAQLLCDCIQQWISRHPIIQPVWTPPLEPIHHSMSRAYAAQSKIGWDQFLCGHIATQWKDVIQLYYKDQ